MQREANAQASNSSPVFLDKSNELMRILKGYDPNQIATLMKLSQAMALKTSDYIANWELDHAPQKTSPAAILFNGPVYQGLDFESLDKESQKFAQAKLRILSGLYGILRPQDQIQNHRLEMGTKLDITPECPNLYFFWKKILTQQLEQELQKDSKPVVVNLASREYSKAIDWKKINFPVVECIFKDMSQAGERKVLMAFAKRARGLMARFLIVNKVNDISRIKDFNAEGYRFKKASQNDTVFEFWRG